MYESHFQFASRPFSATPTVDAYFPAETIEEARQTLVRTIDRAEGVGLVVGPTGVGKTLLCRMLAARFQESFNVALLSSARVVTRKSLLQNILFELGLEYRGLEEGELRLSLLDYLQPNERCQNGMLLIVDEANNLGLRLLEEVRMITNLVRDGQPRVRLVLAGSPKLEERFTSPKLDSFNQRITARCYLHGFTRDETVEYIRTRLSAVRAVPDSVFTEEALVAVHQATDGIPRLVNQVCDHALVMAFAGGKHSIGAAGIEEAWADLQQLPGPWQNEPADTSSNAVVEFGSLDDGQESDGNPDATIEFCATPIEEPASVTETSDTDEAVDTPETTGAERLASTNPVLEEARDPFSEAFEEEVVVVDRSAARCSVIFDGRPRVHSAEGQALAAALRNIESDETAARVEPELVVEEESPVEEDVAPVETSAADNALPVEAAAEPSEIPPEELVSSREPASLSVNEMFEYTVFEPNRSVDLALQTLCEVNIAIGDLEPEEDSGVDTPTLNLADHRTPILDDSEIIEVENDTTPDPSIVTTDASPHQVEYQQLFAQLRHG